MSKGLNFQWMNKVFEVLAVVLRVVCEPFDKFSENSLEFLSVILEPVAAHLVCNQAF